MVSLTTYNTRPRTGISCSPKLLALVLSYLILSYLVYYHFHLHHSTNLPPNIIQMFHTGNTAFFSTCNDNYLHHSVTSLLSIRNYLPTASLYIISNNISDTNLHLLENLNISLLIADLTMLFPKTFEYPLECFYLFAGPQLLLSKGFEYSVYVDGDVLCLANPLEFLPQNLSGVAGVTRGLCKTIFPKHELNTLQRLFNIPQSTIKKQPRIQSGVVFFNNKKMESLNFLKRASDMFLKCLKYGVPRKGDDSLLALLQLTELKNDCLYLHPGYNYMSSRPPSIPNLVFIHFVHNKPWNNNTSSSLSHAWMPYIQKYQDILQSCCSNESSH